MTKKEDVDTVEKPKVNLAESAEQKSEAPKKDKPKKDKTIKIKESEHVQLAEDAAKYKDQYMRLYAEFDNARKRMDRDKQDFIKYANEGLVLELLDVVDNLERTVDAAKQKHEDGEAFLKGIEMVAGNLNQILTNNGVKVIEAKGKKFDPHAHEVLMQEESDEEEGIILEEFQKGYMLKEKVIRTVKVKVAKKKELPKENNLE